MKPTTKNGLRRLDSVKKQSKSDIHGRLNLFIQLSGLSQKRFGEAIGLSDTYANTVGENIPIKTQQRIQEVFPQLNMEWLLKGTGDMLNKNSELVKQAAVVNFLVEKIAEIRALVKGTLASDEYSSLKLSIDKLLREL